MSETLSFKDVIQRVGYTTIDGVKVLQHTCIISTEDPRQMRLNTTKLNEEMYKANRAICRADQAEFEDAAYLMQESYIAQYEPVQNVEAE